MDNSHPSRTSHWRSFVKHFPLLLFSFAVLLRLALVVILDTHSSPYHQSEHVQIADHILKGKGYSYGWYGLVDLDEGSFMPPLYVAVVLFSRMLFTSTPWLAIQILQAFLSAGTCVVVYLIGREVFTELVGIVASLLFCVYPPALGYTLDIQSVVWETFLAVLLVHVCISWRRSRSWKSAMLIGFVWGLGVLSRANLLLLAPFLLIWMILSDGRKAAVQFSAVFCTLMLVLGPWALRNYSVHGDFVLVSTNGGFNFFMGNNENAAGTVYQSLGDVWKQHPGLAKELAQLNEVERDGRLYQEGIKFIQTHPKEAFSLALRKFVYFWWFVPEFLKRGVTSGYPRYFGLIYVLSYAVILPLSLLGFVLSIREYEELIIIYALLLIQTLVSTAFVAGIRFRAVVEPLLIILAAYGIVWVLSKVTLIALHRSERTGKESDWLLRLNELTR